ncbi:hypothetical protein CCHR01_15232 [Colletotrichum chrysophilum]|uniref:Uncharacterized protein n=1 Tax=Colletotrichum chrysophilum TaxID=1836956 RepID=A0AAD9EB67_9PEZI|nr:hypothetical protein CCHR01_15232 [Colletotrichum chrysophilum]
MAVLNELSGVKVTIEVNHVKAQEYSDEDGPAEDKNNRLSYPAAPRHSNSLAQDRKWPTSMRQPDMGIRFSAPAGSSAAPTNKPLRGGTWDPGSGLRLG